MKNLIRKILNEFKIDELSRKDYKDGEIVKKYQKKNGLSQDGVVGPTTWAKMA